MTPELIAFLVLILEWETRGGCGVRDWRGTPQDRLLP